MKQRFPLDRLEAALGTYTYLGDQKAVLCCDELRPARAVIKGETGRVGGIDWADAKYLYLDVYSEEAPFASPVVMFEFWQEGNESDDPDILIRLTCLPRYKTRLVADLSALDAQRIFLPRTPGRFRGFVDGVAVDPSKITKVAIGLREYWSDQKVNIMDCYASDEMPETPLSDEPQLDELGQWMVREWPEKTHSKEELIAHLKKQYEDSRSLSYPEGWSRYGGWKKKQFPATGYFAVHNDGRRWWLADPDGYAFFSTGLDGLFPDISTPVEGVEKFFEWLPEKDGEFADAWTSRLNFRSAFMKEEDVAQNKLHGQESVNFLIVNLIRAFGPEWWDKWIDMTGSLINSWGFNTLGNGNIRGLPKLPVINGRPGKTMELPYVWQLAGYPDTKDRIYRDFPDVFSKEFQESSDIYSQQLRSRLDDRLLIGYFMRNEPEWGFADNLEIAEELLMNPNRELVSKRVMIDFLKERYDNDINAFNSAWGLSLSGFDGLLRPLHYASRLSEKAAKDINDFSYILIREYVRVPAQACKKVDPNHLNFGMRYAFILYPNQMAGKDFMDVFSINCYKIDPSEVVNYVGELAQMPIIVGEYHFGSIDKGLGSTGIIGVRTQKDRALAYQTYLEACASCPQCVGAHYFTLYDQSAMGRGDGENYQIGMLDVCNTPYEDFVNGIEYTHKRMYEVVDGTLEKEKVDPKPAKSNIAS